MGEIELKSDKRAAGQICPQCGRPAAASRPECLYCGTLLRSGTEPPVAAHAPGPDLSEPGYTLFAVRAGDPGEASARLSGDIAIISQLLSSNAPPIARCASIKQAEQLASSLAECGTICRIVHDEKFSIGTPNHRISAIDFGEDGAGLTNFNTRARTDISSGDIVLLVEGTIATSRTDSVTKGRQTTAKIVSETVTAVDDPVLDIYTASSPIGFRIVPSGFDFSVLGERKRMTASENWGTLVEFLAERFPNARLDRSYSRLRRNLDTVWPPDSDTSAKGKTISGFGRRDHGRVASVSNLRQFNIYSRSRRYFL